MNEYKIASSLKPSINWDHVNEEYNYLAVDKDWRVYLYEKEPQLASYNWRGGWEESCPAECFSSLVIPENMDWKESLIKRGDEDQ